MVKKFDFAWHTLVNCSNAIYVHINQRSGVGELISVAVTGEGSKPSSANVSLGAAGDNVAKRLTFR